MAGSPGVSRVRRVGELGRDEESFGFLRGACAEMGLEFATLLQNQTRFLPSETTQILRPVSFRYLELFRPQRIALAWANCEFCGTDRMARPARAHISDVGKGNIEEDIEDRDRVFLRRKTLSMSLMPGGQGSRGALRQVGDEAEVAAALLTESDTISSVKRQRNLCR